MIAYVGVFFIVSVGNFPTRAFFGWIFSSRGLLSGGFFTYFSAGHALKSARNDLISTFMVIHHITFHHNYVYGETFGQHLDRSFPIGANFGTVQRIDVHFI